MKEQVSPSQWQAQILGLGSARARRIVARMWSGVVLAAGRSRRMGTDKATILAGGVPLWRRQLDVLRAAGVAEPWLSARADQSWVPADVVRVVDALPDAGPLAGIAAALARPGVTQLLVIAVDLPAMDPAWFEELKRRCEAGNVGAVGLGAEGFEPLAAIYPAALRPFAEAALAAGDFSLQRLLKRAVADGLMRAVPIAPDRAGWFTNWNAPGDCRG